MPYITARSSCSSSGGDPEARAVAGPGRGRAEEDQPVDALRHGRPGAAAVHRPRLPVPQPARRAASTSSRAGHVHAGRTSRSIVLTLTAGTAMVMWLGELITQRGIGNGMSILIFTSVISRLPSEGHAILQQGGTAKFVVILLHRPRDHRGGRLHGAGAAPHPRPVRQTGRRPADESGGSTYIPLKVNQAGVIPIIFATSVLYFPTLLRERRSTPRGSRTSSTNYVNNQKSLVYMVAAHAADRVLRVLLHGDPVRPGPDTADQIRKQGGFIPGIRPGPPTGELPELRARPHHACRGPCSWPPSR